MNTKKKLTTLVLINPTKNNNCRKTKRRNQNFSTTDPEKRRIRKNSLAGRIDRVLPHFILITRFRKENTRQSEIFWRQMQENEEPGTMKGEKNRFGLMAIDYRTNERNDRCGHLYGLRFRCILISPFWKENKRQGDRSEIFDDRCGKRTIQERWKRRKNRISSMAINWVQMNRAINAGTICLGSIVISYYSFPKRRSETKRRK